VGERGDRIEALLEERAALEACDRAVELDLTGDGLDHDLALAVELVRKRCREPTAHEGVHAAGPARPLASAQPGVGRHQNLNAVAGDLLHLALVPVAGVGEHDSAIPEPERRKLALRGADHRFEMPEVRCPVVFSAATEIAHQLAAGGF
jgi:hypothetical protein